MNRSMQIGYGRLAAEVSQLKRELEKAQQGERDVVLANSLLLKEMGRLQGLSEAQDREVVRLSELVLAKNRRLGELMHEPGYRVAAEMKVIDLEDELQTKDQEILQLRDELERLYSEKKGAVPRADQ